MKFKKKNPKHSNKTPSIQTSKPNEDLDLRLHSIFTSFPALESFAGLKPEPGASPHYNYWQRNNSLTVFQYSFKGLGLFTQSHTPHPARQEECLPVEVMCTQWNPCSQVRNGTPLLAFLIFIALLAFHSTQQGSASSLKEKNAQPWVLYHHEIS